MKKLLILVLTVALMAFTCFAPGEEASRLTGVWRATRLVSGEDDFDLTGNQTANVGIIMTLNDDRTFEIITYAKNDVKTLKGEYDLAEKDYLLLYADSAVSPSQYAFEGETLVLTETSEQAVTKTCFEKCDSAPILGYWRSVGIDTGNGEIDIDGSQSIGMSLYFRADGSCTGIIISEGKSNVRDMTYVASSQAITLIEPKVLSTFAYTLEGDTMICTFFSADGSSGAVYRMIR